MEHIDRLFILTILFFCSAFFSGSETAFTSLDRMRVKYLSKSGNKKAETVDKLLDDPTGLLGTILVGNNLVNIAISVVATAMFLDMFGEHGELATILIITPILLVFSEVCPKSLATTHSEKISMAALKPTLALIFIFKPIVVVISWISRLVSKILGGDGNNEPISEGQIKYILDHGASEGAIDKDRHKLLDRVMDISTLHARDIMIPRTEIVAISINDNFEEIREMVGNANHSRFPVYDNNLDQIVGILHAKEIFKTCEEDNIKIKDIIRAPLYVPESITPQNLLHLFKKNRMHMAIVVDEYGGVEGLVTLEDVVEEIVGDIQDEYDAESALIKKIGENKFWADASTPIKMFNRITGTKIDAHQSTTLAGLILQETGRIPQTGEEFLIQGVNFKIDGGTEMKIGSLTARIR